MATSNDQIHWQVFPRIVYQGKEEKVDLIEYAEIIDQLL